MAWNGRPRTDRLWTKQLYPCDAEPTLSLPRHRGCIRDPGPTKHHESMRELLLPCSTTICPCGSPGQAQLNPPCCTHNSGLKDPERADIVAFVFPAALAASWRLPQSVNTSPARSEHPKLFNVSSMNSRNMFYVMRHFSEGKKPTRHTSPYEEQVSKVPLTKKQACCDT